MVSRVRVFAATLFLALFMLGCERVVQPNEYTEDGRLKILFWHGLGGRLGDVLNDMIREYNESQDRVFVKSEFMGRYDILEQKIIASVMANRTPDLAQMYEGVTMFLTRDKGEESLLDMAPYLKDWEGFSDLWPVFQKNSTYDEGAIYSLPFNKSFPVMFSNMEALHLIGLQKPPKTWKELMEVSERIQKEVVLNPESGELSLRTPSSEAEGLVPMQGFAFPIDPWIFEIVLLQQGGQMTSEDESEVLIRGDIAVNALDFWMKALVDGWGYRTEGYSHQNDFGARKVAFIITSVVSRVFMENKLNFTFDMSEIPQVENGHPASIVSGTNICIFNDLTPERTAASFDFIKWFSSRKRSADWARRTFYVPVRKAALEDQDFQEWQEKTLGADAAIRQLPIGESEPRSSAWYRCRIILREVIEKVLSRVANMADLNEAREYARREFELASQKMNRELGKYTTKKE